MSLLPGDARLGSADTAEMVAAREAFLGAGHFDPLSEALGEEAQRALGDEAQRALGEEAAPPIQASGPLGGCVVDLGAGTGWYLARMLDRLPGRLGIALDLSKHALRRAARAHPRVAAVACDAWRGVPVRDSSAALVLSVFAPRNGAEIARVLRPDGALVVATPTERHLGELVAALDLITVDVRKQERLRGTLEPHLELDRRVEAEWALALSAADVANAVAMGPSARHRPAERFAAMSVTASVTISTYRGRPG